MRGRTLLAAVALLVTTAGGSSAATNGAHSYPRAIVYGTEGGGPWLSMQELGGPLTQFLAYFDSTVGGLHVATGDVDGDGRADIVTGPGWAGRGELRVFDGSGRRKPPTAMAQPFGPGVQVAAGDVTGDGRADLVASNDRGGGPNIQVFDAASGRRISFFGVYNDPNGRHGTRIAAGDVNGDGRAEIVTADDGGVADARVRIFTGIQTDFFPAPLRSFQPFGSELIANGLQVAVGDLTGDRRDDVVVAGETEQGPRIKVYDGASGAMVAAFSPFDTVAGASLRVAVGDVDGDGRVDVVAAGDTNAGPSVRAFSSAGAPLFSLPGIGLQESIAVGDVDGDGRGDIVISSGPGFDPRVVVLDRTAIRTSFSAYQPFLNQGVRVAVGDLNADGSLELIAGQGPGNHSEVDVFGMDGALERDLHPFDGATSDGVYVAAGDLNGDRKADVVVGADAGGEPRVKAYDNTGRVLVSFLAFDPGFRGGVRVATGDIDGDGKAEILVGAGPGGPPLVRVFDSSGDLIGSFTAFSPFDTGGVYVAGGDLDGDGRAEIVVGAGAGTAPYVRTFDQHGQLLGQFRAYEEDFGGGVRVAVGDADHDGEAEIATAPGPGRRIDLKRFLPNGDLLWGFRAHDPFEGGVYVALQAPVGPRLDAAGIDWITREGKQADGQWATFSDPSGGIALPDDFSASIEWGDGTRTKGVVTPERPGFYSVRATKAYRRFGQFPITVYVTDRFLRIAIAHGTATVLDAPVSVWGGKLIGRVGRPVRGRVAIITDDNQLAHRTDFRTTISWGDGRSSAGRLVRLAPGRFAVIGRHDYRKPGRYVARVRVHEAGLSELQARTTVDIRDR